MKSSELLGFAQSLEYDSTDQLLHSLQELCRQVGLTYEAQVAYIMATIQHETGGTYEPIEEYCGRSQARKLKYDGGENYFGRGYVQITHRYNYEKFENLLSVDLVKSPEKALDCATAAVICVYGFKHGTFTGRKLEDYIGGAKTDYIGARRVINGNDRASKIAEYTRSWLKVIRSK